MCIEIRRDIQKILLSIKYVSLKVLIPINWLINPRIFM